MSATWNLRQMFTRPSVRAGEQRAARHKSAPAEMMTFGDFQIDLTARTATLCGRELELTSEEFDVLVFLTSHPQRLITPHTMLATSLAARRVRQIGFMRALISLRRKLEATAGLHNPYLQTEFWVAYRFDPGPPSGP